MEPQRYVGASDNDISVLWREDRKMQISEFRKQYRHGPFAWPGGYPRFAVCNDGGALCFACLKTERRNVLEALATPHDHSGWSVEAFDINWEDPSLLCDHCSARISSAYAEDDAA